MEGTMKTEKKTLMDVKPGERFTLDGVEFVKLDEDRGVAFVVTADVILGKVPFDSERETERNNFVGSGIEAAMLEWLGGHPGIEESVVERPIDLTSMDGLRDYGAPLVRARILTIDEYREYRALIPLTEIPYWTATAWTTESSPYSGSGNAYRVSADGALSNRYVNYPCFAARPALYLRSDIAISVEGDEVESSLSDYTELELLEELYRRACK